MRIESVKEEQNLISEVFCKKAEKRSMLMGKSNKIVEKKSLSIEKARNIIAVILGFIILIVISNSSLAASFDDPVIEITDGKMHQKVVQEENDNSVFQIIKSCDITIVLIIAVAITFFTLTLINILNLKSAKKINPQDKSEIEEKNSLIKKYKRNAIIFSVIMIIAIVLACVLLSIKICL